MFRSPFVTAVAVVVGVLAYTVAQRAREIGLRMARRGIGRLAESMLYQMKGTDPLVLVIACVLLALVALGAGFIPAHRASRIDPMRALRYE